MLAGQHQQDETPVARKMGVYKSVPHLAGWSHNLSQDDMNVFIHECFVASVKQPEWCRLRESYDECQAERTNAPDFDSVTYQSNESEATQCSLMVFCLLLARFGFLPFRFSWSAYLEYAAEQLAIDAREFKQHQADQHVPLPSSFESADVQMSLMSHQQRYVFNALGDPDIVSQGPVGKAYLDAQCFSHFNDVGGLEAWARFVATYKIFEGDSNDLSGEYIIAKDSREELVEEYAGLYRYG